LLTSHSPRQSVVYRCEEGDVDEEPSDTRATSVHAPPGAARGTTLVDSDQVGGEVGQAETAISAARAKELPKRLRPRQRQRQRQRQHPRLSLIHISEPTRLM
jgi:hypothetical protein